MNFDARHFFLVREPARIKNVNEFQSLYDIPNYIAQSKDQLLFNYFLLPGKESVTNFLFRVFTRNTEISRIRKNHFLKFVFFFV